MFRIVDFMCSASCVLLARTGFLAINRLGTRSLGFGTSDLTVKLQWHDTVPPCTEPKYLGRYTERQVQDKFKVKVLPLGEGADLQEAEEPQVPSTLQHKNSRRSQTDAGTLGPVLHVAAKVPSEFKVGALRNGRDVHQGQHCPAPIPRSHQALCRQELQWLRGSKRDTRQCWPESPAGKLASDNGPVSYHTTWTESPTACQWPESPTAWPESPTVWPESPTALESPRSGLESPRAGLESPRAGFETPREGLESLAERSGRTMIQLLAYDRSPRTLLSADTSVDMWC